MLQQNPKSMLALAPLLLLFQTLSFSQASKFLFLVCLENGKKNKGKGFYKIVSTSFQVPCLVLVMQMERKQREVFYEWKENEESGLMITSLVTKV